MKLIASHTSPFARKVRVLLEEKRIAHQLMEENVWSADTAVTRYNPLTKIPTLILDNGETLFDSAVITEYLDALSAPAFIPASGLERARVRRDEALADGLCDAAVGIVLERKREAMRQDAGWVARQRGKVETAITAFSQALGERPWLQGDRLSLSDIAAGCALFYVEFRLPEITWRKSHENLSAFADRLDARPSFASTRPPRG